MKGFRGLSMLLSMVLVGVLSASPAFEGSIFHQQPSNVRALEPLTLEVLIESDQLVVSVTIYHRVRGQNIYLETPMSNMGDELYFGTLPASEIQEAGLEYYIVAILADESALAYPDSDPINTPASLDVAAIADIQNIAQQATSGSTVESEVLILAPDPNQVVLADEVVVAVSLFNLSEVDVSSIQLFVDGEDVTAQSDISIDLVSYSPPPMALGNHSIEMRVSSVSGASYTPTKWTFWATALASETSERSFKQSGRFTSGYRKDDIDSAILAVQNINVSYNAGWDWLKLKSRAKFSSEEDPFKQARNRYSVKIEMPIMSIGIGDVTPRVSKFGMDGKRVRGFDFNLKLKLINLQVVQGELERSIAGRDLAAFAAPTYDINVDGTDTTYVMNLSRKGYTFKRDVTAIRPSFGSGEVFEWAFFYVSARDNVDSVPTELSTGFITSTDDIFNNRFFMGENTVVDESDTTIINRILNFERLQQLALTNSDLGYLLPEDEWDGRSPQDNIVLGSDIMLALNKRRFVVKSGFAFSMRNSNIWDPPIEKDSLDTFAPGDNLRDGLIMGEFAVDGIPNPADFADFFIINLNMIPLLPIDPFLVVENPMQAVLKMPSMAYHASVNLNYFNNYITASYEQVGPEFESFANPNIQKNVRIKSVSDRLRMFRNKLMFNVQYKTTDDDIVKYNGDVITTSTSLNYNAVLNLGSGLPSLRFGKRTYTRDNLTRSGSDVLVGIDVIERDSLIVQAIDGSDSLTTKIRDPRSSTLTASTNIGVTYRLRILETTHDFNLNIANTLITDEITDRPAGLTTYHSPYAKSDILSLGVTSAFSRDFRTNLSVSTNNAEFGVLSDSSLIVQELLNLGATFTYRMFSGKLMLRGGLSMLTSNTDQSVSKNPPPPPFVRIGIQAGLEYAIFQNLRFVSGFEFRNKSITMPDGGTETSPSSIISANLAYVF